MGRVIGTVRVLPMNQGLAPCDAVLASQPSLPGSLHEDGWEVGRLVLAPEYRAGPELLRRCLALTLLHMVERVPVQNIFASCKPVLARLYRRFGYTVLVQGIAGPDGESYCLIHGMIDAVMRAVADHTPVPAASLQ
jgi:predicted GNAT family N-acyltransferase